VAEAQAGVAATTYIRSFSDHPIVILLVINAFLLLVGCLIEPLPAMIIFVPPSSCRWLRNWASTRYSFGAVIVLNLMIGLMHPPIGLLLFVVSSVWAKYPWDR
jgi:TRAP-type C4-dicarboxylate transport system permease large subunit